MSCWLPSVLAKLSKISFHNSGTAGRAGLKVMMKVNFCFVPWRYIMRSGVPWWDRLKPLMILIHISCWTNYPNRFLSVCCHSRHWGYPGPILSWQGKNRDPYWNLTLGFKNQHTRSKKGGCKVQKQVSFPSLQQIWHKKKNNRVVSPRFRWLNFFI